MSLLQVSPHPEPLLDAFVDWKNSTNAGNQSNTNLLQQFLNISQNYAYLENVNLNADGSVNSWRFSSREKLNLPQSEQVNAMLSLRTALNQSSIQGYNFNSQDVYLESDLVTKKEALLSLLVTLGKKILIFLQLLS